MIASTNPAKLNINKVIELIDTKSDYFKFRCPFEIEEMIEYHEVFGYLTINLSSTMEWSFTLWTHEDDEVSVTNYDDILEKIQEINENNEREVSQLYENH